MIRVVDATETMLSCFPSAQFQLTAWESYVDAEVPGAKELCLADMRECVAAGFSWENDFLPVLNSVPADRARRNEAVRSFHAVADTLDRTVKDRFGKSADADLILYLGLCNGAGWVTPINGTVSVLFGIEKILELDWCGISAMTGLVLHELGHVYQSQHGVLHRTFESFPDRFLWQLFTEGIAMVFEQEVLGDPSFFHQYDEEWRDWCGQHVELIKQSFRRDLETMTPDTQRYFGDWVRFEGRGDTGYYLGARFVRFLLRSDSFDSLLLYEIGQVKEGFELYLRSPGE